MADGVIDVPLYRYGVIEKYAVIDEDDRWILDWKWLYAGSPKGHRYAYRVEHGAVIFMHRAIASAQPGEEVDHIDRDRLNNRRSNLRALDPSQNKQNRSVNQRGSSRYRGVRWVAEIGKWRASAKMDGKQHSVGLFESEDEAGAAVAEWRREHMPYSTEVDG